jgi:hypothetical protein
METNGTGENKTKEDKMERAQYLIFKWVLFVIFLYYAYKFLDDHIHITRFVYSLFGTPGP